MEFKLGPYDAIILTDTSSGVVIKVSVFILIAAALYSFL